MREDAGLLNGAEVLWQKGLLYDYTITVQHLEIKAHKFILASVSDYFRAMLCGTMAESTNDSVELKEVNGELLADLIKFVYTGDTSIISSNLKEMLDLAVYFQMSKVIDKCQRLLLDEATLKNCFELLTLFDSLSLKKGVEKVAYFIKYNVYEVRKYHDLLSMTPKAVDIIIDGMDWMISDVHGFIYVIKWLDDDYENRKEYAHRLLGRLKLHLLSSEDITEIMEMPEYNRIHGTWKDPIEKAFAYHNLPAHQRLLKPSGQTNFEVKKSLVGINAKQRSGGLSTFYVLHQSADMDKNWKICKPLKTPKLAGKVPFTLQVNNYLITCSEFGKDQTWQVFDPTTLDWLKMTNMSAPRDKFAMVQHDGHLYVLGGCIASGSKKVLTDTIEEYSFDSGTWSCTKKLPVAVKNHSACVLNGCIYVSGGELPTGTGVTLSARLDCLNLSTGTWESKAAMLRPLANHKMSVMMVEGKETIVVVDQAMKIQYYDPLSDQWTTCEFFVKKHNFEPFRAPDGTTAVDCKDLQWRNTSTMLVDGNTIYFLNLTGLELDHYESKDDFKYVAVDTICVKWVVGEEKRDEINEYTLPGFTQCYLQEEPPYGTYIGRSSNVVHSMAPDHVMFGLLAFPPELLQYKKPSYWD